MTPVIHDVVLKDRMLDAGLSPSVVGTAKALLLQDLRVPIHIALGRFEAASQEELEDLITDLNHELNRRSS